MNVVPSCLKKSIGVGGEREGYIQLIFLVCSSTKCLPDLVFVSYIINSLESSEEIAEQRG